MATPCPHCKAENPDEKKFCGDCGASLADPLAANVRDAIDAAVAARVEAVLHDRYKDQKLLEVETTQAIAERFSGWAKLLGFFVGVPVALLLLVLGLLGVKTYGDFSAQVQKIETDFSAKVQKIETDTTANMSAVQDDAKKLKAAGDTLTSEYAELQKRFQDTSAIADKLQEVSDKVEKISERLNFTATSHLSEAVKKKIGQSFAAFQQYVQGLGYRPASGRIDVDVRDDIEATGTIAFYDPEKHRMVIDSKYVSDPPVLYREYMHHVLFAGGAPKADTDKAWTYYAIESGLAWYLPLSYQGTPSSPSSNWNLASPRTFDQIQPNAASAQIDGTEIWGATFWDLRKALGRDTTDRLLYRAWGQLHPEDVASDRGVAFEKILLAADPAHAATIQDIFARRGLKP